VEDIDTACDLSKVGGLPPLLATLRGSPHVRLRSLAAEVVATCVQNNPKAQQALLDAGALQAVLSAVLSGSQEGLLSKTAPPTDDPACAPVRLKALLAVSSLVRNFPPGQAAFRLGEGFAALRASLGRPAEPKLQRRALSLAQHFAGLSDRDIEAMVQLGFVRGATAALLARERDVRESALGFLLAMARNVDFDALPVALAEFRHPGLAERLRVLKAALGDGNGEADEERRLVVALLRMLQPGGDS